MTTKRTVEEGETQCRGCDTIMCCVFASDWKCNLCNEDLYFCDDCKNDGEPENQYCPKCWGKLIEEEEKTNKRKREESPKKKKQTKRRKPCNVCKVLTNDLRKERCMACRKLNDACFCTDKNCKWCENHVWRPLNPLKVLKKRVVTTADIAPPPSEVASVLVVDLTKDAPVEDTTSMELICQDCKKEVIGEGLRKLCDKCNELKRLSAPLIICDHCKKNLIPFQKDAYQPDICSECQGKEPKMPPLEPVDESVVAIPSSKEESPNKLLDLSPITLKDTTIADLRDKLNKMGTRQVELREALLLIELELAANEKDSRIISKFLKHYDR